MRALYGIGLAIAAIIVGSLCADVLPEVMPGHDDADLVDKERKIISLRWLARLLGR